VKLGTIYVADAGWHYDDDTTITKLVASVQRHGQLRPLVVRGDIEDDTMCVLVEGHKLLGAMLSLGMPEAMVVHLGELDADAALRVALALELDFETDYGCMVQAVAGLVERGAAVAVLAAGSPFAADRIKHMTTLAKLDWSVFGEDTAQAKLDWDVLEEPAAQLGSALPPMLALDTATGVVTQVPEPLEDITEPAAPQAAPAAPEQPRPAAAEPAAAPQGAPETPPGKAAKARPPKVPKAPDAQLGLF